MANVIRVNLFGGIIPRLSDRGLPDNAAQFALNAKLYSGELRAWNQLKELGTLPIADAKTVYHYRFTGLDRYLAFSQYTNVVKSALINETLGRIYWTNASGAFVNTAQRIEDSDPPFKLGVPRPGGSFTVAATGGTEDLAETRVYLLTLVTTFGEESAPSDTVTEAGNNDGTWTVTLSSVTADTINYPNIEKLRLYRTVTSSTGVDYRQVAEWNWGSQPASYADTVPDTTVGASPALPSLGWSLPPEGLRGLTAMAGGFNAGFVGRTVRFSHPYQPHAWPEDFQYAVEDNIVGLAAFGNTLLVATEGRGYMLVGQSPEVMTLIKMDGVQPCLSERGLVSTVAGAMYPSTDGLVLVDGSSNRGQIVSRNWATKDEWLARFSPDTQMASVYQDRYFAFYSEQLGFTIGFDDPVTGCTELQQDGVSSVDTDPLTGQTLITIGDKVYEWDGEPNASLTYQWRSKPFMQPKPVNFAALQLRGTFSVSGVAPPLPPPPPITGYTINANRINGGYAGVSLYGGSINGAALWMINGTQPGNPGAAPGVIVRVYGDDVLRWTGIVNSEAVYRLPSGYKAVKWEIEVLGDVPLYSLALAETAKVLENVP